MKEHRTTEQEVFYQRSKDYLQKVIHFENREEFEDMFTDAFLDRYEYIRSKFNADRMKKKGYTEIDFFCYCLRKEMYTRIKKENIRKRKIRFVDLQDELTENDLYRLSKETPDNPEMENKPEPLLIQNYLIDSKIENGLISAGEIKEKDCESLLYKYNLPSLKRKAWTAKHLITERNYRKISQNNFKAVNFCHQLYTYTPKAIYKIQRWIQYPNTIPT